MKKTLLILIITFLLFHNISARYVIGYYYGGYQTYPASAIKYDNLTHICHAFIWPNSDGTLYMDSWFLYPELIQTAHKNGVKVLIALGGYGNSPTSGFSTMSSNPASRAKFVSELVKFCQQNGYDGADLDWEYPKAAEKANFVALVTELRQAFNNAGIKYLSAALPSSDWNGSYDIPQLADKLDWFGIMTYDFTGPWETTAYHNSALYNSSQQPFSANNSVNYYYYKDMPLSKMCIGTAFYGYLLNTTGMYKSLNTVNGSKGAAVTYNNIVKSYLNNPDWDYFFDNTTKNPYLQNKTRTQLLTFDDTTSVRMKCEYINSKNLGGTIIWAIGQGYNGTSSPLLDVVGKYLIKSTANVEEHKEQLAFSFELTNYPNPFNPSTTIRYTIPYNNTLASQRVKIRIIDMIGREVSLLVDSEQSSGTHEIIFNGRNLPSGIYFCKLESGNSVEVRKLLLSK